MVQTSSDRSREAPMASGRPILFGMRLCVRSITIEDPPADERWQGSAVELLLECWADPWIEYSLGFGCYPRAVCLATAYSGSRIGCPGGQQRGFVKHIAVSPGDYLNPKVIIVIDCHELSFVVSRDSFGDRMTEGYSERVRKNETHATVDVLDHSTCGIPVGSCDFSGSRISSRDLYVAFGGHVRIIAEIGRASCRERV